MIDPRNILVLQTAFPGDVILTIPLMQELSSLFPGAKLTFVAIPSAAGVLRNHPAIDDIILYDKRGVARGVRGVWTIVRRLRSLRFDVAIVPHRSLRSAVIPWLARIPVRIAFDSSAGRILFTNTVHYRKECHEVERNLDLLGPLTPSLPGRELPVLYPSAADRAAVDTLLRERNGPSPRFSAESMIAVAPGSVWNTKRWPEGRYAELCAKLSEEGHAVVLVGGIDDRGLCAQIADLAPSASVLNAAGRLEILQSAELIGRCKALVCNDSAPMHLGVAMRTPVIALFGATVPEFGFAPLGAHDEVLQTTGLPCRPCSIHGGTTCPIGTFDCMLSISPVQVLQAVRRVLTRTHVAA